MSTLASVSIPLPPEPSTRSARWALIRAWIPTMVWVAVIAFESTSVFTSEHTQSWLHSLLQAIFGSKLAAYAPFLNDFGRKVGHFTGYAILSAFSFIGWTELLRYRAELRLHRLGKLTHAARRWHLRAASLAVLVTFLVASLDEFHQSFVPGRGPAFHDVILDTMGGVFAQTLILLIWSARKSAKGKAARELETVPL
jgi:VanZ family protein